MKKLFFTMVAVMVATLSYAQNTLVATLSHGDNITMYYGTNALRDAMNDASSGDIINLSGGAFQSVDITKGITLRGTGIDDAMPTYISGDFTINIPTDDANRLSFEGVRCTGWTYMRGTFNSPYFVKSQFWRILYQDNATIKSAMFINCKITESFSLVSNNTVQLINCFVNNFDNQYTDASATFINCVIRPPQYMHMNTSQFINCIICYPSNNYNRPLSSSSIATNCLSIGYSTNFFDAQTANTGNNSIPNNNFTQIFKDYIGSYSDARSFELTDEAKTTYLGTDGTEIGMYGGILPYNSTPSYPQITKMNVANKTTADGKLSVEIEVNAAE